jgi:pyrroloquinoline quinone biosynthesis protein B
VGNSLFNVSQKDIHQDLKQLATILLLAITFAYAKESPYVLVLGIAQDGGMPHAGCMKSCCKDLWKKPEKHLKVSAIAIIDPETEQSWMIDATPDFPAQQQIVTKENQSELKGIFLTHGHIGHYTGLMHLGREVMGASSMPVFAMPRMKSFLQNNGPWDQLVSLNNIAIRKLKNGEAVKLTSGLSITPFLVPHRDEYTETVGYRIDGPEKSLIYIPDIDKWLKWEKDIRDEVTNVDYALLDGSFYANGKIPNRDMSAIPHPFVTETMDLFNSTSTTDKSKIYFIHLNHTNPALKENSVAFKEVNDRGYRIAYEGQKLKL